MCEWKVHDFWSFDSQALAAFGKRLAFGPQNSLETHGCALYIRLGTPQVRTGKPPNTS